MNLKFYPENKFKKLSEKEDFIRVPLKKILAKKQAILIHDTKAFKTFAKTIG